MKIEKFKVLLYLKKSGMDKNGKAPIMGRITVNRTRKGRKTAHRQGSQAVEVCHGEVLKAKLRGFETEGEESQPQVGGVHP